MLDFDFDGLKQRGEAIVYLLSDPRPDRLECYVGQTIRADRFKEHMKAPKWSVTEGKSAWISELISLGLIFNIDVIGIYSKEEVDKEERFWIGRYEHSPHHILVNGAMDRGIFSQITPDDTVVDLLRRKPNLLASVNEFQEMWCYFMSPHRVVDEFHEGYRLLRKKEAYVCSETEYNDSIKLTPKEHWERVLGPHNYALLCRGITGKYTAETAVSDGDVKVTLTDYVQWVVKTYLGYQTPEAYRVAFNQSPGPLIPRPKPKALA